MREKAVLLGKAKALVGIVTFPTTDSVADVAQRPGIIFLNSGTLHRVGPNRLYVKLARKFAAMGFLAVRFDLSGIGDSVLPGAATADTNELYAQDTRAVMDHLAEAHGIKDFILMGLCSGADNAFRIARLDSRVVGVNLLEPFSFPTTGYFASAYKGSLISLRSWKRLLTGQSEVWGILRGLFTFHTSKQVRQLTENWELPPKEEVVADLHALLDRDVSVCFVYAASGCGQYNYRKLLQDAVEALPEGHRPRVEVLDGADHLFTLVAHQEWLTDTLCDWIDDFRPCEIAA